jgi:hypothetical protein
MLLSKPRVLLHCEGVALFAVSVFLYHFIEGSWTLFFVLFLWPDLLMAGYLANAKLGATFYNLAHTEVLPLVLAGVSVGFRRTELTAFALIWLAHIGLDRALGYGLKYPTFFKDTHLQRVA